MDKDYADTLLRDINNAKTTDEKLHLQSVFMGELATAQQMTTEAIQETLNTSNKVLATFKTLNDSNEKLFERIVSIQDYIATNGGTGLAGGTGIPVSSIDVMTNFTQIREQLTDTMSGLTSVLQQQAAAMNRECANIESMSKINQTLSTILNRLDRLEK